MAEMNNEDYIWSIKNGDFESISKHIESQPKIINQLIKGRTYLHYACDYGQLQIIEYLLSKGADINISDKYNITPLLAAIWENHVLCVDLLIRKGANVNSKTPDGKSLIESTENPDIKYYLNLAQLKNS